MIVRLIWISLFAGLLSACNTITGGGTKDSMDADNVQKTAVKKPMLETVSSTYSPSNQAIGDEADIADRRARGLGLVEIPALSRYLNGILDRIKHEAKLANAPGKVYLTADSTPSAEASADGNIYVSISMLRNIENEDEIVALLAHEFGHVALGHHDSDVWGNYQKQFQTAYAIATQLQSNAKAGQANAVLGKGQSSNLQKLQLVIELTDKVLHPAWKRHQEEQADYFAIDVATRMGYSFGRGLKSLVEKITALEENTQKADNEAFQKRLDAEMSAGKLDLGALLNQGMNQLVGQLSRSHAEGKERIASAAEYHEVNYDDLPRPSPRTKSWEQVIKQTVVAAILDRYSLADEASRELGVGNVRKSLELARKAATAPADRHPYTLLMLARAQEANGDRKGYDESVRRLGQLPEPVWAVYQMRAETELRGGRHDRAENLMEEGYTRFGHAPSLRPTMIGFYNRINRKEKANSMVLDCSFKTPIHREECMKQGGQIKRPPGRGAG